jgi:GT2 family glycosyltransferase
MPETSIIILTYNGLHDSTVPCLDSLREHTEGEDYEIVAVDNGSSDGTPDFLAERAENDPRLRCVLNEVNRGFAGGNNDGIRAARGNLLVLLNNDTRVGAGWLAPLCATLRSDRSVGLVGPVSNEVGNEQRIFTEGAAPDDVLSEGAAWVRASTGDLFETERLGFFCVGLRRDTVDDVGFLDEAYDLGFYEDDDYCVRIRRAGYRLACREDVFVYHRGSAAFGKDPAKTAELLRRNRRLLERKFGIRYRPRHPRDRQLDLVASYVEHLRRSDRPEAVRFKIANRMRLLDAMTPRGPWKRLLFHRRAKDISRKLQRMEEPAR